MLIGVGGENISNIAVNLLRDVELLKLQLLVTHIHSKLLHVDWYGGHALSSGKLTQCTYMGIYLVHKWMSLSAPLYISCIFIMGILGY